MIGRLRFIGKHLNVKWLNREVGNQTNRRKRSLVDSTFSNHNLEFIIDVMVYADSQMDNMNFGTSASMRVLLMFVEQHYGSPGKSKHKLKPKFKNRQLLHSALKMSEFMSSLQKA